MFLLAVFASAWGNASDTISTGLFAASGFGLIMFLFTHQWRRDVADRKRADTREEEMRAEHQRLTRQVGRLRAIVWEIFPLIEDPEMRARIIELMYTNGTGGGDEESGK